MTAGQFGGHGSAATYLARVNLQIVKAAARRRQRTDQGAGERLPAALAGAPVQLVELKRRAAGGKSERVTYPGYKTARRADPQLLASLPEDDPRRRVARMLVDAVERTGSVKGVDLGGSDSKGGISDGGATTRVKHAARYRMIEALANRWPVDARHGPQRKCPRVALQVKREDGKRKHIQVFAALVAVCVLGHSLDRTLRRHGWSAQAFNRNRLRDALLEALDEVAEGLGFRQAAAKNKS